MLHRLTAWVMMQNNLTLLLKQNESEHNSIKIRRRKTVILRTNRAVITPTPTEKRSERFNKLKLVTSFNMDPPERIRPTSLSVHTGTNQNFSVSRKLSTSSRSRSKRVLFVIVVRFK